eukprot:Nitzschia sp. Nitz4//scaffold215_size37433//16057//17935//NITZ4_007751-RA/size37433-processed-gene-0.18-mRNA-1//-1//CDS//3329542151//8295//frame0
MSWSRSQQVALALAPKFSSLLSFIGSTCIIIEIVSDRHVSKPKWRNPYHRLMLGMSIYDVLESIFNFLSTWLIPKGTKDIAWAIGNEATCTTQGFFLMLGIAIPIYNACLSLYYVLVINFRYTDTQLRRWVEPSMHLVAFAWGFGTALSASVMELMNNANLWCWIAPLPVDCVNTLGNNGDAEPNCDRGNNAWLYRWLFYFVPLWLCILFANDMKDEIMESNTGNSSLSRVAPKRVNMAGTMASGQNDDDDNNNNAPLQSGSSTLPNIEEEKETEDEVLGNYSSPLVEGPGTQSGDLSVRFDTSSRNGIDGSSRVNFDLEGSSSIIVGYPDNGSQGSGDGSNKMTARGVLTFAKAVTVLKGKRSTYARDYKRTMEVYHQSLWYLGTFYITHFWSTTNRITQGFGDVPFPMLLLHSIFDPLQGFLNFIVYQRPRYLEIRKKQPNIGRLGALLKILRLDRWSKTESQATHTSRRSGLNSQSRQSLTKSEAVSNFDESNRG